MTPSDAALATPAAARSRRSRPPARLEVLRTERLTPAMQRVILGGPGFADLVDGWRGFTDSYVKLVFPDPDAEPGSGVDDPWYGGPEGFLDTLASIEAAMPGVLARARSLAGH